MLYNKASVSTGVARIKLKTNVKLSQGLLVCLSSRLESPVCSVYPQLKEEWILAFPKGEVKCKQPPQRLELGLLSDLYDNHHLR